MMTDITHEQYCNALSRLDKVNKEYETKYGITRTEDDDYDPELRTAIQRMKGEVAAYTAKGYIPEHYKDADNMKRMSVALPPEVAALLEQLATSQGVTQVEALRMAIKTEAFLQAEIRAGSKVVLVSADGTQKVVVFR